MKPAVAGGVNGAAGTWQPWPRSRRRSDGDPGLIRGSLTGTWSPGLIRPDAARVVDRLRSEEHTSELQSLMRISYAVFCLKKKKTIHTQTNHDTNRDNLKLDRRTY